MRGSLKLGNIAGIGIYVHWTFVLLIAYVVFQGLSAGGTWLAVGISLILVLLLFACVVLHELGHALTARRFGVQTRDITLLPIGGLARLQRMPDRPLQELLVAIAGPAVNVVIALLLLAGLLVTVGWDGLQPDWDPNRFESPAQFATAMATLLMVANVILVLFNLLPAFPMDGGRALRALLATTISYSQATQIAAWLGQGMAVLFAIAAFLLPGDVHWPLLFIAVFVYLGAEAESRMVQMRVAFQGVPVRDAMITRFATLHPDSSLTEAIDALLTSEQRDYPVVRDDELVGILISDDLARQLRDGHGNRKVSDIMRPQCASIDEREMLDRAFALMNEGSCRTLPVYRDKQLVGLISLEHMTQFLMIRSALRESAEPDQAREYVERMRGSLTIRGNM